MTALPPFAAVAFDFDGTLVDTMELHFQAYREVFACGGVELAREDFFPNVGGKAAETIPLFLRGRTCRFPVDEIHLRKKQAIARIFAEAPLKVLPAARLLSMWRGTLPMALVSSGSRAGIEQLLKRLGWLDIFAVVVTGEDTKNSKPAPDPYLLAADRLKIPPAEILALEDTEAGLQSARAAGMSAFNVTGS